MSPWKIFHLGLLDPTGPWTFETKRAQALALDDEDDQKVAGTKGLQKNSSTKKTPQTKKQVEIR